MKKLFLFVFVLLLGLNTSVFAQDDAMMKQWTEFMTPGDMHKHLQNNVGTWTGEIKMWMAPNTEPIISTGTAVTEPILGGRYFRSVHKGSFNNMPMEGIDVTGFDNARKVFFSFWIDNFGTGTMYLEGKLDDASKTVTLTGTSYDYAGKPMKVRETFQHVDNDNTYMEMFVDDGNGEFKTMEVRYKRTK